MEKNDATDYIVATSSSREGIVIFLLVGNHIPRIHRPVGAVFTSMMTVSVLREWKMYH